MRLPSGVGITEADFEFLKALIKPPKAKQENHEQLPCWYCENGHDRQHIELGKHSYDMCDCGASIVIWSKKRRTRNMPHAKLAGEVAAILKRNYNPAVASRYKTKAMI